MIRIDWQGQRLDVRRLVFRPGDGAALVATLTAAADRHHLEVADDRAEARPGDFWVGCHPRTGWGDADPERVGWASVVEVPVAVEALKRRPAAAESLADPTYVLVRN